MRVKRAKAVGAYVHAPEGSGQAPDGAPGPYYVSAVDGPKFALVSGPYERHEQALAALGKARGIAVSLSPWAAFSGFGTVRCKPDCNAPGKLQEWGYDLELNKN